MEGNNGISVGGRAFSSVIHKLATNILQGVGTIISESKYIHVYCNLGYSGYLGGLKHHSQTFSGFFVLFWFVFYHCFGSWCNFHFFKTQVLLFCFSFFLFVLFSYLFEQGGNSKLYYVDFQDRIFVVCFDEKSVSLQLE